MAGNIFQQGMDAFDQGYDRVNKFRQDRAQTMAAPKLARGDYAGAAQEYGAGGMAAEAGQAFGAQQAQDDRARQQEQAVIMQRAAVLNHVAEGLKGVPLGRRKQALDSASPLFQQAGVDPSMFAQLGEQDLTNEALDAFTGHVVAAVKTHVVVPGAHLVGDDGKSLFDAPFAPQYKTVGQDQSLVEVNPQAPAAAPHGDPAALAAPLTALGAKMTSGTRTPEHNAEVGGVPNSRHLTGDAADLVPPPGMTLAQLGEEARRRLPGAKVIVESDHVHVQVAPQAQSGARVIAQGPPKPAKVMARPATPQEKAQYGIPADVPAQVKPDGSVDVISGVGARNKQIPAKVQQGYIQNNTTLAQIDAAITALKARPQSMGAGNIFGDEIRQRMDPDGIKTRAAVANIGAVKIHDLSGAAVTAAETPRLKPFIPMPTDTADAAIKKLEQFREQVVNNNNQMEVQYGPDSGYTPLAAGQATASPAPRAPPAAPAPRAPAAGLPQQARAQLKPGHNTTFANGQVWTIRNGQPTRVQ
jgi:hypothetical protein